MVWDRPNPSPPHQQGFRSPLASPPLPHVPTKGDDPHQATLFPHSSPATSSLSLKGPSWDVGWGLTHLPQSRHCPWCAQPAPACPCLAPGGHKGAVRANPSLVLDGIPERAAPRGWAEPKGLGREGSPPTCHPPFPLTSPTCSTLCSLLAKTPSGCPWLILPGDRKGGGSWAAASPSQPDTTSRETPQNHCWHFGSLQAPRGHGLPGAPQIPLWG